MAHPEGAMIERRDLLLTLAEELSDLSTSAASLQGALGRVLEGAADRGAGEHDLWHLQEIDRLQQTLDDLSVILRRAAEQGEHLFDVEHLIAATRLGALRERLRGGDRDAGAEQQSGVVALF